MSYKSMACATALLALMTTSALAVPSLSWVDNLDGTVTLQITPSGIGSIDAEITFSSDGNLTSAIVADATTFDTVNPGNNPITGTVTNGLWLDLENDQLFASFGSIPLDSTAAVSFITIGYGGFSLCNLSAAGLVAEGGATFTGLEAGVSACEPPMYGDFDNDGDVDGDDFGVFVGQFGNMNGGPPFDTADFDMDGDVDGDDFGLFVGGFDNGAATTIPEPTAALLLLVGATVVTCTLRLQRTAV